VPSGRSVLLSPMCESSFCDLNPAAASSFLPARAKVARSGALPIGAAHGKIITLPEEGFP
jgi:hypothetical protein